MKSEGSTVVLYITIGSNAKFFSSSASREKTSGKVKFTSFHMSASQLRDSELRGVDEVI